MKSGKITGRSITMDCNADLIKILDLCKQNDVDLMIDHFTLVIKNDKSQSRVDEIRRRSGKNKPVGDLIMDLLFVFDVSIQDMYECFSKYEFFSAANVLKSYCKLTYTN